MWPFKHKKKDKTIYNKDIVAFREFLIRKSLNEKSADVWTREIYVGILREYNIFFGIRGYDLG